MRYFIRFQYNGTPFQGWQKQPKAPSVQAVLEQAMSLKWGELLALTGCGRTDTGVHASDFYAHFDAVAPPPRELVRQLNRFLPDEIAVLDYWPVNGEAHARYSALSRTYRYLISRKKDPFSLNLAYYYPYSGKLDPGKVQSMASLIASFTDFKPFSKTHGANRTDRCVIQRAQWNFSDSGQITFTIQADRFLRGMVRLITGACLDAGRDQLSEAEVRHALETQTRLRRVTQVPAHGLYLCHVEYPAELLQAL